MQTQPQPTFGDRFVTVTGAPGPDECAAPLVEPGEVGTVINRWEVYGTVPFSFASGPDQSGRGRAAPRGHPDAPAPTILVRLLFWPSRQTLEVTESTLLDQRLFLPVPLPTEKRHFALVRNLDIGTPVKVYLRQVAADPVNAPDTWLRAQVGEEQGPQGDHWVHLLGGMGCTVLMAGNNLVEVRDA